MACNALKIRPNCSLASFQFFQTFTQMLTLLVLIILNQF